MNLESLKAKSRKWLRYVGLGALVLAGVMTLTVVAWEGVRDEVFAILPDNTVTFERVVDRPATIDGLIKERAESWLNGPEAFEYAKEKVTDEVIRELSKI